MLMHWVPEIKNDLAPSWIAYIGYILMAVIVLYTGRKVIRMPNPNSFTSFSLVFILTKMLFSASIILVYTLLREPQSKLFILPFFLIYIVFTIFESNVIIKIGKS